jgi:hypothetical protein
LCVPNCRGLSFFDRRWMNSQKLGAQRSNRSRSRSRAVRQEISSTAPLSIC